MVLPPPKQWPKEVSECYTPVKVLGQGGFGSVVLGRRKTETPSSPSADDSLADPNYVAIKVVGSQEVTSSEIGYAHREMDILQELSHPNIMKVLRVWEPAPEEHLCAAVMVLSYAKGPTLYDLIRYGGALSTTFGRVVVAQIVDAMAYVHYRAVVHRDIKSDNFVVTGATLDQDDIWDNHIRNQNTREPDWATLRKRWHVTCLDFGFARALTPDDIKKRTLKADPVGLGASMTGSSSSKRFPLGNSSRSLSRSTSRLFSRQMSAVGNRDFAAPEITKRVELKNVSTHNGHDILHTLSKHQANYGLQVDAYSLGVLMRNALTGVPPHEDVNEFIAMKNSPLILLFSCCVTSKPAGQREAQYRGWDQLPGEVLRLIKGLTHYDPQQRTTIRTARCYPWIDDVLEDDGPPSKEVNYLDLVKEQTETSTTSQLT